MNGDLERQELNEMVVKLATDNEICDLQARNAKLVAALEAILAKDENGFLITPLNSDLLEQVERALGR